MVGLERANLHLARVGGELACLELLLLQSGSVDGAKQLDSKIEALHLRAIPCLPPWAGYHRHRMQGGRQAAKAAHRDGRERERERARGGSWCSKTGPLARAAARCRAACLVQKLWAARESPLSFGRAPITAQACRILGRVHCGRVADLQVPQ